MAKPIFEKLVNKSTNNKSHKVSKQLISKLSKPKSLKNKPKKERKPIEYKTIDQIISSIDENLIKRILSAIDEKRSDNVKLNLLDEAQPIFITFTTYDMIVDPQVKPLFIKVPNSIYSDKNICVIVKDPHEPWKEAFKSANIPQIKKIIGLKKLKTNYREYIDKRKLCDTYDLFICDKTIVPSIPSTLGKYFIQKHKLPIAYKFEKPKLPEIINKLLGYVYFTRSTGPSSSVKVGYTSMSHQQLIDNIKVVISDVANFLSNDNKTSIRAIHLSWSDKSLPLLSSTNRSITH